jgi:hypothetical protein
MTPLPIAGAAALKPSTHGEMMSQMAPGRASWCLLHVVKKHRTPAERVILLQIDVPRRWMRRCKVRGL